ERLQGAIGARRITALDRRDEPDERAVPAVLENRVCQQPQLPHVLAGFMAATFDEPEKDQLLVISLGVGQGTGPNAGYTGPRNLHNSGIFYAPAAPRDTDQRRVRSIPAVLRFVIGRPDVHHIRTLHEIHA